MNVQHEWFSRKGSATTDNRDFLGISYRKDETLYIVVDGATGCPKGGKLAEALVKNIVDGFLSLDQPTNIEQIMSLLEKTQTSLKFSYHSDSASYLLAIQFNYSLIVLHAGDCRLGKWGNDGSISWLTAPHTLANATNKISEDELIISPKRHLLTRGFRGKRFCRPDSCHVSLQDNDSIVIATDGFWADLSHEKRSLFAKGVPLPNDWKGDDVSVLSIRCVTRSKIEKKSILCDTKSNVYQRSYQKQF